jgi:hypothetical protein
MFFKRAAVLAALSSLERCGTRVPRVIHGRDARAQALMLYWPLMADTSRFTIICPCCEATLNIDSNTGALLSHEEKQKPLASFEGLVKDLDKQKQTREQIFSQEMSSMKDRERLLEEKFKEAMKRAEKDKDKVYRNPLDLD